MSRSPNRTVLIQGGGSGASASDITSLDTRVDVLETGNAVNALSNAAGVVNINCALGDYFTLTLGANVTSITFTNRICCAVLPSLGNPLHTARICTNKSGGNRSGDETGAWVFRHFLVSIRKIRLESCR